MKKGIILSILIYIFVISLIIVIIPFISEQTFNSFSIENKPQKKPYSLYHEIQTSNDKKYQISEYITEPTPQEPQALLNITRKDKPLISIVIDDFGYSKEEYIIRAIETLPITVAIIPFLEYSVEIYEIAKKNNREVLLHIPMEAYNNKNNENKYLKINMPKEEILNFLEKAFKEIDAEGINNHMGSKATEDENLMEIVISFLKGKNKIFLDSFTSPKTVGFKKANELGLTPFKRDIFIDNYPSQYYILDKLKELEAEATKKGYVIAIGHAREETIKTIEKWYEQNKNKYVFTKLRDLENLIKPQM
ncbi:MAG: divergent polysaccharide deacetylase family protein [Brevinematia bacterium]